MSEPRSVVREALTRFVLLSFGTLVLVGAGAAVVSDHIARDEAVRDARARTVSMARRTAAPLVDGAVRRREPAAMQALTRALEGSLQDPSVTHILLWDDTGRVLWSDDPSQVGFRSPLPDPVRAAVEDRRAVVMEPGEREPHPGRQPGEDSLLEVYVGAVGADGEPFVFEAYASLERLHQESDAIFRQLLPISLGALLLLQLATLPLALSLARRIDRATQHRSQLLSRSLLSWHEERRRLAQDLHDGVIQDLSAMSYALPAVLAKLPDDADAEAARSVGERMADALVEDLRALRSLLVDLVPAGLDGPGLVAALETLAERSADRGLPVELSLDPDLDAGPAVAGLVYRVVREGLRNAEKHAGARTALVRVSCRDGVVETVVRDDGRGPRSVPTDEGHVGLRLLAELVSDVGGTLELGGAADSGAELRVLIPAVLPGADDEPGR